MDKVIARFGFLEQVIFSMFSFLLIIVVGAFESADYAAYFVKVFALVSLVYILVSMICIHSYCSYCSSSDVEHKSEIFKFSIAFVFIASIAISILSYFIFLTIGVLDADLYSLSTIVFLSVGWCVIDLYRKANIISNKERYNFICVISMYVPVFLYALFDSCVLELGFGYEVIFSCTIFLISLMLVSKYYFWSGRGYRFNRDLLLNYLKFGKPLVVGAVLFWGYSQGIYFIIDSLVSPEYLVDARMAQNITGLIGVVVTFFEVKYLSRLGNQWRAKGLSSVFLDVRVNTLRLLVLFLLVVYPLYFLYAMFAEMFLKVTSSFQSLLLVFTVSTLIFIVAKPAVVALRFYKDTKKILVGHFSAATITLVLLVWLNYWDSSGYWLVFIYPYLAFTIPVIYLGLKKYENFIG